MKEFLLAILVIAFVGACGSENNPAPHLPVLIPVKLEEQNYTKELFYDVTGKLKDISSETRFVDGTRDALLQTLLYNSEGRLIESLTDAGLHMIYSYDNSNRIIQTDEYENSRWVRKYIYNYDDRGLMAERITYQNVPAEGGIIPISREIYEYNASGNVTRQQLFEFDDEAAKLRTSYVFSDYDDKINTEEYFDAYPFNPLTTLQKNNPGKLVIQNAVGVTSSTEIYSYLYNNQNYAVEKTTSVTFYHGGTGSYTTHYSFKSN
jgi:hypothetical protein